MQDVPANGALINVGELTSDELATLGITKDRLGNGRWFEVVYIRRFDQRDGADIGVELHCLHRSDVDVDALRRQEADARRLQSAVPNYERLAAFFRDFGRGA
jgi:hypothetical protein